jgi:L-threonylcarbamoyladenylate synthase
LTGSKSSILAPSAESIKRCAESLLAGELVGLPTETVYGLAGDASDSQAIMRIYDLKGRPADHPLIVHVSGSHAAQFWIDAESTTATTEQLITILMERFWPGPLTLIVNRAPDAPRFACAAEMTVGLRCPSHPVAQLLLQQFEALGGRGVAAPSANKFGKISPTTAQHVLDDLGAQCPLTLDGGECEFGIESTIVDLSSGVPRVLRLGSISVDQINQALSEHIESHLQIEQTKNDSNVPKVSGSLAAHYAPTTPLELVGAGSLVFRAGTIAELGDQCGVLSMRAKPDPLKLRANLHWVQVAADSKAYAHSLYSSLRALDQLNLDRLLVELPPTEPNWLAVLDRLKRSAAGAGRR